MKKVQFLHEFDDRGRFVCLLTSDDQSPYLFRAVETQSVKNAVRRNSILARSPPSHALSPRRQRQRSYSLVINIYRQRFYVDTTIIRLQRRRSDSCPNAFLSL